MCLENQGFKCWVDFLSNFVLNTCMREKGHADACNEDASEGSRSKQNTRRPAPLLWDRKNKVPELQGGNQSHTHSRSGSSAAFHQAQVRIWSVTVACSFSSFFVLSWSACPGSWAKPSLFMESSWGVLNKCTRQQMWAAGCRFSIHCCLWVWSLETGVKTCLFIHF